VPESITSALTLVIAVSIAVERVTEILKQMVPLLGKEIKDPAAENRRRAALQVLAAAVGALIAWTGNLQLGSHLAGPPVWILIGLMASSGSGFWNHALDAVRAMKVTAEKQAAK